GLAPPCPADERRAALVGGGSRQQQRHVRRDGRRAAADRAGPAGAADRDRPRRPALRRCVDPDRPASGHRVGAPGHRLTEYRRAAGWPWQCPQPRVGGTSPEQEAPPPPARPHASRGRLRRSGQALVRVGAMLLAISLVVGLVGGLTTRSLINNLRDNSAELLDGSTTVSLSAGAERALYVTGGLVAPGEDLPTPVEDIDCTVTGPGGDVPVTHLSDEGQRVGLDNPLARFQVVGSFRADQGGEHTIQCD